ncbi:MAG: response regulator, partial [Rheinheimera sp.]
MRLLIVEDEIKTGDYLKQGFIEAGFNPTLCRNGLDGHHLAMTEAFDLIILDVMLPDVDGLRIIKALRQANRHTPVLFLSALDSVDDRVRGLELGADDYLVKPFAFNELLARVRTLLRRGYGGRVTFVHYAQSADHQIFAEELAELDSTIARMEGAPGDAALFALENQRFHRVIARASGNTALAV